jgi:hypothetical protein
MKYGMFSLEGNLAIAGIVAYHKAHKSPWSLIQQNLRDLADSNYEKFGEAYDTDVREAVYNACDCTGPFFI